MTSQIKQLIHPETISKRNIMYRCWRLMLRNRVWKRDVPDTQYICLWFWPALFATAIFTPFIYPLLLTIKYLAYAVVMIILGVCVLCIYYPLKSIWVAIRFLFRPPIERFIDLCSKKLWHRFTYGHVFGVVPLLGFVFIPHMNYWYVGTITVLALSFLGCWLVLSMIPALWREGCHLIDALCNLWHEGATDENQQGKFLAVATCVSIVLVCPFFFPSPVVSFLYLWIMRVVLGLAALVLLVIIIYYLVRTLKERRAIEREVRAGKPAQESWTHPIRVFISAKKKDWCPQVRFN